jgi:hypothetical protein
MVFAAVPRRFIISTTQLVIVPAIREGGVAGAKFFYERCYLRGPKECNISGGITYVAGIWTGVTLPCLIGAAASHYGIESRREAQPIAETYVAVTATMTVLGLRTGTTWNLCWRIAAVGIVAHDLILFVLRGNRRR